MNSMRLPEHRPKRVRAVENTKYHQVPTPQSAPLMIKGETVVIGISGLQSLLQPH